MLDSRKKASTHGDDPKAKKGKEKPKKKYKNNNRLLITVNVLGSAGPIRLMVNENDPVHGVIDATLKSYAREGRLPILGSDAAYFLLHSAANFEAMSSLEAIGCNGGRNFVLCKKQMNPMQPVTEGRPEMVSRKAIGTAGRLKAWLHKSLSFKVLSH